MKRLVVLALLLSCGCSTLQELPRRQRREHAPSDADHLRWRQHHPLAMVADAGERAEVLVLPELGFDHRLVGQLCFQLRKAGFDVATLDGREVTGAGGHYAGLAGWTIDVARAVAAHGPQPIVVAVGLGGDAALEMGRLGAVRGVVAINVPLRHAVGDEALRLA